MASLPARRNLLLCAAFAVLLCIPIAIYGAITELSGVFPNPANGSFTPYNYFITNFTFTNTSNADTCLLEHYNTTKANYTMTMVSNATGGYCWYNATGQSEGAWNFSAYINETAGTVAMNGTWNITVDTTFPSGVVATAPTEANGSAVDASYAEINFTFIETNPRSCILGFNNGTAANHTMNISTNATGGYCWFNATSQPDGAWNYTVHVNDSAGNINSSVMRLITLDANGPTVSIALPANTTYGTTATNINYTVTDSVGVNATWLDYNGTNTTLTGNGTFTALANTFSNVTVWANDSMGNVGYARAFFSTDTQAPSVTLSTPGTGINSSNSSLNFSFTATDNLNTRLQCNLTIDGTIVNSTTNAISGIATGFYHTISNLSQALHYWNVTCRDNASATTATSRTLTYDATYPTYTIDSPQSTTYSTGTNMQLNYSSSDTNLNATYYSIDNLTNYTLTGNVTFNASEGFHNVSFHVNDSAGNLNSTRVDFTVDLTTPVVTALTPASASTWSSSSTVDFTYNVSDVTVQNCTLVIDPANDENSTSVTPNTTQSFSATLTNRVYTWYIRCYDKANRTNLTSTRTLTVSYTSGTTQQSAGSGQSGSGSSNQTQDNKDSKSWDIIGTVTPSEMNVDKASIPITNIKIDASESMAAVSLSVEVLSSKPSDVTTPSGSIYKYLKLDAPNLNETRTKSVAISFKIEKSWADANGIDENSVALLRYTGGQWVALPTTYKGATVTHHLYSATTPGFSFFAINGSKRVSVCTSGATRCANATSLEACNGTGWALSDCKYGCDNASASCFGALSGDCTTGQTKCQGSYVWNCVQGNATNGTWTAGTECAHGCVDGACVVTTKEVMAYALYIAAIAALASLAVIVIWHKKIHHVARLDVAAREPMKSGSLSLNPIILNKLEKMDQTKRRGKPKDEEMHALKNRIETEASVAAAKESAPEKAAEEKLKKEKAVRKAELKVEEKAIKMREKAAADRAKNDLHTPFTMPVPPEDLHIQKPKGVWLRGRLRKWDNGKDEQKDEKNKNDS